MKRCSFYPPVMLYSLGALALGLQWHSGVFLVYRHTFRCSPLCAIFRYMLKGAQFSDFGSKTLAGLIDMLRKPSPSWRDPLLHFIPRVTVSDSAIEKEIIHADGVRGMPLE